jgi:hypothetical protein
MKKIFAGHFYLSLAFLLAVGVGVVALQYSSTVHVQASTSAVTGWAWSDNIGWISLGGPSYAVNEDSSGNLTGWAWSDNIGWIKFGGLTGFPSGSGTSNQNAQIDSSGALHGWVRACAGTLNAAPNADLPGDCSSMTSRSDGWDGWISLNGSAYGVNFASGNGQYSQSAYTWGSDVVGWITFNPSNLVTPPCDPTKEVCGGGPGISPTLNLYINGGTTASVATGTPATLSWNTSNVTTCSRYSSGIPNGGSVDSNWSGAWPSSGAATSSGSTNTSAFQSIGTETYSMTCQSATGVIAATTTLTVTASIQSPPGNGLCPTIANATKCSGPSGSTSGIVSSCPASSADYVSPNECEWVCNANTHQVGTQCINNGGLHEN